MTDRQLRVHTFTDPTVRTGPGLPRAVVILLGLAAVTVTVAGMRATAWLLAPVLLALVIVIAVAPVQQALRRRGFPAWSATVVLLLLVYGVIIGFGLVVFVSLAKLITLLPRYASRFDELVTRATGVLARAGVGPEQLREVARSLDLGKLLPYLGSVLSGLTGLLTSVTFLLALLFFLSAEAGGFGTRMAALTRDRPATGAALAAFATRTRRYLVVTTVFGLVVAVLDTVALAIIAVPLAVLWGLLSFATNYIPNVGFLLGLGPPALLALLGGGWRPMIAVIGVYCLFNLVIQSLIQPYYVGDSVGLSATVTFLALVFWSWVLGPLGAILAIPVTLLVRSVLLDMDPGTKWFAVLLHLSGDGAGRARRGDGRRLSPDEP
ncbi:AI-2E family transporter [Amycolatopsis acidiphila]|uniref:AI-2E family transporter n=1 Tax=Amycolatopsis acidiphila TaxID=715473 RepID=A0A558ANS0_9PSEU|nr:AI-2E family transporter [Amycolatopsis acidiphila]TVT25901.1 AI-2E family transporter [Amycolatopsis acidiphila]UIJ63398.1 AI-2E family transporter [Amycolatopsis acidiphila]